MAQTGKSGKTEPEGVPAGLGATYRGVNPVQEEGAPAIGSRFRKRNACVSPGYKRCLRVTTFQTARGESEFLVILPATPQELAPARVVISVRHAGQSVADAGLLALFPNKTWKQAITDASGQAVIELHTGHLPVSVFAAAEGFAAQVKSEWIPAQGPLTLELNRLPGGGSVIFNEATGQIPGVKGRLNPIRDTHDRTYLYASDIAINQGRQQPIHFLLGEELHLTDANGREMFVRIIDIVGRSALVEYRPVAGIGGRA